MVTITRATARAIATAGLGTAIGLSLVTAVGAADRHYYWKWSDGSRQAARTFAQAEYGLPSNLPSLVVTADPALPRQYVYLQFYKDGRWTTEYRVRTDAKGVGRIAIDPLCDNGAWCEATFRYRLKAGDQTASLTITYAEE